MFFALLIVAISAVIALLAWLKFSPSRRLIDKALGDIPEPPFFKYPIIGNAHPLLKKDCLPWDTVCDWITQYGAHHVMKFEFMTQTFLFLGDLDLVKEVLGNPRMYLKDSKTFAPFRDLLGKGLVTAEGDTWHRERGFMAPAFKGREALRHIGDAAVVATRRMLQKLDGQLETQSGDGEGLIEWSNEFRNLTLQVIAQAVMSLPPEESDRVLPRLYLPIVDEANKRTWHPWRMLRNPSGYKQALKGLNDFVDTVVGQRWEELDDRQKLASQGNLHLDILDRLLDAMVSEEDREGTKCPQWIADLLRDEIKTFLLAGHETSSMMLTYALLEVARHPGVQQRVLEEAQQVFGKSLFEHKPEYAQLNSLNYAEAVLKEALRMYSVVPVVTRETKEPREVRYDGGQRSITLPAGVSLVIPIKYIHQRNDLWGDPENFRPDRWLNVQQKINIWQFLGFLAGPRFCIGQHFALLEAKIVLAMLVYHYKFSLSPTKTDERPHRFMIPTCPLTGLILEVAKR